MAFIPSATVACIAVFDRRDLCGTGRIHTEGVKEVLRDLGSEPGLGKWLLNQFGVRQSTWHPYNEVFLLVQDVMSRAPSSATGQSYSATGHGHG